MLVACDEVSYTTVITNNSKKDVSYIYNNKSDTLPAGKTKNYEVKAYTGSPINIVDQNGIASVKIETNNLTGNYTFVDAKSYKLIVNNEYPFDVTIRADNFIDNDGSMELTINANDPEDDDTDTDDTEIDAIIYTERPNFKSTLNFPLIFEWEIVKDKMNVTVK